MLAAGHRDNLDLAFIDPARQHAEGRELVQRAAIIKVDARDALRVPCRRRAPDRKGIRGQAGGDLCPLPQRWKAPSPRAAHRACVYGQ